MRSLALSVLSAAIVAGCGFSQDFQLAPIADAGAGDDSTDSGSGLTDGGCGTSYDPENCGACGHNCGGGTCASGLCQAVVLATGQGDSAYGDPADPYTDDIGDSLAGPDRLAVDDTDVYWLNLNGDVMRMPITGGEPERVSAVSGTPIWLQLDDSFVYFALLGGNIYRAPKAGGPSVQLATTGRGAGFYNQIEFVVNSGQIQWADGVGLYACPVTGCQGAPHSLQPQSATTLTISYAVAGDGTRYVSETFETPLGDSGATLGDNFVRRVDVPSTSAPVLEIDNQATLSYELHGDAHDVYALTQTPSGVVRIQAGPSGAPTILASGADVTSLPRSLALDSQFVYWVTAATAPPGTPFNRQHQTGNVLRCAKTGCAQPEVVAGNQIVPRAVAIAKGIAYWTTGDGRVMKLALPVTSTAPTR